MKRATVRDLHKLCMSLIEDGYIEAELSFNSEFTIRLGEYGMIDYETWQRPTYGNTVIDIQP